MASNYYMLRLISPQFKRYGMAILFLGTAIALRFALSTLSHPIPTYITFYPAVMLAALVGGFGPGIFVTLSSATLVALIFEGPHGMMLADSVFQGVFVLNGFLVSFLAGKLENALVKLRETNQQLFMVKKDNKQLTSDALLLSEENEETIKLIVVLKKEKAQLILDSVALQKELDSK